MSEHLPAKSGGALPPQHPFPEEGPEGYPNGSWEPAAPLAEPGFDWRRYLTAVWRYKWLVLLVKEAT